MSLNCVVTLRSVELFAPVLYRKMQDCFKPYSLRRPLQLANPIFNRFLNAYKNTMELLKVC